MSKVSNESPAKSIKPMTRRERVLGWLSDRILVSLAFRAMKRGDYHEVGHISLAMDYGDTGPGHDEPCPLVGTTLEFMAESRP